MNGCIHVSFWIGKRKVWIVGALQKEDVLGSPRVVQIAPGLGVSVSLPRGGKGR